MRNVIIILIKTILILLAPLLLLAGCKTMQMKEKVNARDSIVIHYVDSIRWHYLDSIRITKKYVTVQDSSGLIIQFGAGGGTYNAKTGEATNVAGVHHTDTHHEQRDSTSYYRCLYEGMLARSDSFAIQAAHYTAAYEKECKNARTSYDRFCSRWFWITIILLIIKLAVWIMEKYPATAHYVAFVRRFVPFL